jgi:hypothetical protein
MADKGRVAFGSSVPGDERKVGGGRATSQSISVFQSASPVPGGPAVSPPHETPPPAASDRSRERSSKLDDAARASPNLPRTGSTGDLRWKSSASPAEMVRPGTVKITNSHIGTYGPEDEIRGRLRQTLSMSSVRIEPENEHAGLSSSEVRLLAEVCRRTHPQHKSPKKCA